MWAIGKVGIIKYASVCVYAPANARSGKRKEEVRKFWNYVIECLMKFGRVSRIVLIGGMNGSMYWK